MCNQEDEAWEGGKSQEAYERISYYKWHVAGDKWVNSTPVV